MLLIDWAYCTLFNDFFKTPYWLLYFLWIFKHEFQQRNEDSNCSSTLQDLFLCISNVLLSFVPLYSVHMIIHFFIKSWKHFRQFIIYRLFCISGVLGIRFPLAYHGIRGPRHVNFKTIKHLFQEVTCNILNNFCVKNCNLCFCNESRN